MPPVGLNERAGGILGLPLADAALEATQVEMRATASWPTLVWQPQLRFYF